MIKLPWVAYRERKEAEAARQAAEKSRWLRVQNVECRLVAVHRITTTRDELRSKIAQDPHYTLLDMDYLIKIIFSKLYMFDLWVGDAGAVPLFLDDVTQYNDEGQAPYSEVYFDETGERELFTDLERYNRTPPLDATYPCRVRFFMHLVSPRAALEVAGLSLKLPDATPLPEWLNDVMPYRPPN